MKEVYRDKLKKGFQRDNFFSCGSLCILNHKNLLKLIICINLFVATFFVMFGYAGMESLITHDNNRIDFEHYSIELPTNHEWMLAKLNKEKESVTLTKRDNSSFYEIIILRQRIEEYEVITAKRMKSWGAEQFADFYRAAEVTNMNLQGVMKGMFVLKNVVNGEEMIGDRKYYTMEYIAENDNFRQKAYLYLYLPKEKYNYDFIVSIYSESTFEKTSKPVSLKQDFIDTLTTIKMRQSAHAFNYDALTTTLQHGLSTTEDVRKALGKPNGSGEFLYPNDTERLIVWFYDKIMVDISGGKMNLQQDILMIFFREDIFDGFLWYSDSSKDW